MEIIRLKHNQIDKRKWDDCIANASNSLIYACSWYLDAVSPSWDALVYGDYQAVMPLTWKRKYGIKYLVQPAYCQQLGVFFQKELPSHILDSFLQMATRGMFKANINLNSTFYNHSGLTIKNVQFLNLNRPFEEIYKNYSDSNKKNIRRALRFENEAKCGVDEKEFLDLKRKNTAMVHSEKELKTLERLVYVMPEKEIWGIYNGTNELIAAALFPIFNHQIYYLTSATTHEGKDTKSMFLLTDALIQHHANTHQTLNFVGSTIPSIAYFNLGFGADAYTYPTFSFQKYGYIKNMFRK